MTNIEAMKLALDALLYQSHLDSDSPTTYWNESFKRNDKAMAALRQATSEAEQEKAMGGKTAEECEAMRKQSVLGYEQAEQKPVAWLVQYKDCHTFVWGSKPDYVVDGFVEPLYTAPPKAAQEPVAWLWSTSNGSKRLEWEPVEDASKWSSQPLYTAPPQQGTRAEHSREWVSLTDDEIHKFVAGSFYNAIEFARAIETKLKELNK